MSIANTIMHNLFRLSNDMTTFAKEVVSYITG